MHLSPAAVDRRSDCSNSRTGRRNAAFPPAASCAKLRGLAAKIKRDHQLALELSASGNIDAMNLATLITDPKQLKRPEVEKLAKDLSY